MVNDTWELIQYVYKTLHNIPPQVVDYMAVEHILALSVDGKGNRYIAFHCDLDIEYVIGVLNTFLEFYGWDDDLDISPIMVYNMHGRNYLDFKKSIQDVSKLMTLDQIKSSYWACRMYEKIGKELKKYVK